MRECLGRRKCWSLRPERPWPWSKVQTTTKHRSEAPMFISHPPMPRSSACQDKATTGAPAGPPETLGERREGGRLRSSLLWKENEHNLVDLVEGPGQWGPSSFLFLSSVVCCQVVASSATVRGGGGERPPKSEGPCSGSPESGR